MRFAQFLCVVSLLVVATDALHRPMVFIPGLGGSKLVAHFGDDFEAPTGLLGELCAFNFSTLEGRDLEVFPHVRLDDDGPHFKVDIDFFCIAALLTMVPDGMNRVNNWVDVDAPGFGGFGEYGLTTFETSLWLRGYMLGVNYRTAYWDWRQSPPMLDWNSGWMTNLQYLIGNMTSNFSNPVVLVAHSAGNHMAHYFLSQFTGISSDWKATNLYWYVSIGSTLGGIPSAVGAAAIVLNSPMDDELEPVGNETRLLRAWFIIGLNPFMVWAQPQDTAWDELYPYFFEVTSGYYLPETCADWSFSYVIEETGVNGTLQADPSNYYIWPETDFYQDLPGVDSTVVCGYNLETGSTMVYDGTSGILGLPGLVPAEVWFTPGATGDTYVLEQICNCSVDSWTSDVDSTTEYFRINKGEHGSLPWLPEALETWIHHAIEGDDTPGWWPLWSWAWSETVWGTFKK